MRVFTGAMALIIGVGCAAIAQSDTLDHPTYVGSDACSDCHEEETAAWSGSHHAKAWTPVTPENLLGQFNGVGGEFAGEWVEFHRTDTGPEITVTHTNGVKKSWPVHSVVGVAPLQQYLLETEAGRLQSFDVVWDVGRDRWYHLYPDQALSADDGLHWSGPYKNWNARCAACHATGFSKGYDPASDSYASTQVEIGVGCEACHGPSSDHIAWANGDPPRSSGAQLTATGFTVDLAQGGEMLIQQCASCHARREAFGDGNPLPGTPFADAYRVSLLSNGVYHADGQILEEVYVYGSFLQSKMYAQGVTCMDCHTPHTAQRIADDNSLCTQCHNPAGNGRFPSLRQADYDTPEHHHHPAGSEGAQCKNCHMIERVYMGIDGRRDHSFRVPRPDLARRLGTPDACTDCHKDREPAWAQGHVETWYPDSDHRGPHYGDVLAAGRFDPLRYRQDLLALAFDQSQPGIVRATALSLLAPITDPNLATTTAPLLEDTDTWVRDLAIALQRGAPGPVRAERLSPRLRDAHKAVRISAARSLFELPPGLVPAPLRGDMATAMEEWQASILANFDFPEQHMVLGGLGLTMRNSDRAEAAFARAVSLDPQLIDAWSMRVRLAEAVGDLPRASAILDSALAANPDDLHLEQLRARIPSHR